MMKTTRKQLQKLILEAMAGIASMPSAEGVDQIEEPSVIKNADIEYIAKILEEGMIVLDNRDNLGPSFRTKTIIENDNTIVLTAGPLDTPFAEITVNFKDLSYITKP